eukprot:jgi/Bigna1/71905/fgenesh1_pg.17_\
MRRGIETIPVSLELISYDVSGYKFGLKRTDQSKHLRSSSSRKKSIPSPASGEGETIINAAPKEIIVAEGAGIAALEGATSAKTSGETTTTTTDGGARVGSIIQDPWESLYTEEEKREFGSNGLVAHSSEPDESRIPAISTTLATTSSNQTEMGAGLSTKPREPSITPSGNEEGKRHEAAPKPPSGLLALLSGKTPEISPPLSIPSTEQTKVFDKNPDAPKATSTSAHDRKPSKKPSGLLGLLSGVKPAASS